MKPISESAYTSSAEDGLPQPQRNKAMLVLMLALTMATLDTAIANVALPTIAAYLHTSEASSIWVVNSYQLAMVAALLPLASLGEIVGLRRIFVGGLVLFTVSSAACGLADTLPVLAAARIFQGLGAAAVMSVNAALIRFIYPSRLLGRALGLNALIVALGFAVGPTLASAILAVASWKWLFLINVPIGLGAMWLARRSLPATPMSKHAYDRLAALLSAGLFLFFVLGFIEVAHGAAWQRVTVEWAIAAVCGYFLVRRQSGHPAPILPLDLFKRPVFTLSVLTSICSFAAQGLAFVALPFMFSGLLGGSETNAGFLMTPWPVMVGAMAPFAGKLADRFSTGLLGFVGLAGLAIGMGLLAMLPAHASVLDISWRMAICGAGFGFFQSPNLKALMASAPPHRSGGASGMISTSRLLGQSMGAALVATCFNLSVSNGATLALWLGSGFAAVAGLTSVMRVFGPKQTGTHAAPAR
jgi:DHA2 family multidrug resistance protein-like MFS transporter